MVNKKAIAVYIILLVIVASLCSWIYFFETGKALYNRPQIANTVVSSAGEVISAANGLSGGAVGTIARFYNQSYAANVPSNSSIGCEAGTSYTCTAPEFYPQQGIFTFNFSQSTGATWQTARLFFLNYTEIPRLSNYLGYSYNGTQISGLGPGVVAHMVLYTGRQQLGAQPYGEIWGIYQLSGNSTTYYAMVGKVTGSPG